MELVFWIWGIAISLGIVLGLAFPDLAPYIIILFFFKNIGLTVAFGDLVNYCKSEYPNKPYSFKFYTLVFAAFAIILITTVMFRQYFINNHSWYLTIYLCDISSLGFIMIFSLFLEIGNFFKRIFRL